jgi:hypothetical protein
VIQRLFRTFERLTRAFKVRKVIKNMEFDTHEEVLTMFEVTQRASDIIKEALKDREEISPIRIMLRGG